MCVSHSTWQEAASAPLSVRRPVKMHESAHNSVRAAFAEKRIKQRAERAFALLIYPSR